MKMQTLPLLLLGVLFSIQSATAAPIKRTCEVKVRHPRSGISAQTTYDFAFSAKKSKGEYYLWADYALSRRRTPGGLTQSKGSIALDQAFATAKEALALLKYREIQIPLLAAVLKLGSIEFDRSTSFRFMKGNKLEINDEQILTCK